MAVKAQKEPAIFHINFFEEKAMQIELYDIVQIFVGGKWQDYAAIKGQADINSAKALLSDKTKFRLVNDRHIVKSV